MNLITLRTKISILHCLPQLDFGSGFTHSEDINNPFFVQGSVSNPTVSTLEFADDSMAVAAFFDNLLNLISATSPTSPSYFILQDYYVEGSVFELPVSATEIIKTIAKNTIVPPWEHSRLPVSEDDQESNPSGVISSWLDYWVTWHTDRGLHPWLFYGIASTPVFLG